MPVALLPTALTYSLAVSLVPSLSEAAAGRDRALIHKRLHQSTRIALVAGAPFAVAMYLFAEPICRLLYDHAETDFLAQPAEGIEDGEPLLLDAMGSQHPASRRRRDGGHRDRRLGPVDEPARTTAGSWASRAEADVAIGRSRWRQTPNGRSPRRKSTTNRRSTSSAVRASLSARRSSASTQAFASSPTSMFASSLDPDGAEILLSKASPSASRSFSTARSS